VALALAEGDAVVATVRRPNPLSELAKTYGEHLIVEQLDVTDREHVNRVIARCLARGRIDIVVNNAGGGLIGATEEMTDTQVQEQIALTLLAPIQILRGDSQPATPLGCRASQT
jgi:NAD(P)-dependent dehydrogenase (short-subunit alcohol dehydrogenase family)